MRVALVAPRFHPVTGGIETHLEEVGVRLLARGHEVTVHVAALDDKGAPLPPEGEHRGLRIRRYKPSFRLGYYSTLFKPDLAGADVIHLHAYAHLTNDWAIRRYAGSGKRLFLTTHHGFAFPTPGVVNTAYHGLYNRLLGMPNLRKLTAVIPMTGYDRDLLLKRGFPAERVHVVPNGVPDAAFTPGNPGSGRALAGIESYVLFLGRLHPEKRPLAALSAFSALADRVPGLGLVFAGPDQGEEPRLRREAQEEELADRVRFLGKVTEDQKRDLLAGCRLLVLPSLHEGQGIVLIEAWAQGRPVVATRVGGVPYTVEDGIDGLLATLGDEEDLGRKMELLARHPDKGAAMGEAGRRKAWAQYRWDRIVEDLERLYRGEA